LKVGLTQKIKTYIDYITERDVIEGAELYPSEPGITKCVDRGKKILNDDSEPRSKFTLSFARL